MKKQIKEHDGCDKCKYEYESCNLDPCYSCKQNHNQPNSNPDLWEDAREEPKESLSEESNPVKPNHYKSCSIECIDAMILTFGTDSTSEWCLITAYKYIWRYKYKGGLEDLKKATYYIDKSVELTGNDCTIKEYRELIERLKGEYNE